MAKKSKKKSAPKDEEVLYDDFVFEDEIEEGTDLSRSLVVQVDSVELPAAWGQTQASIEHVRKARKMANLKHGMFANVPMVCKGAACPLHAVCSIPFADRPIGQRCPIEIGLIIELYDRSIQELGISETNYFDLSQVKDLVDTEIKLMRASGRLATIGDFIVDVASFVDDKGHVHYHPELDKATDYEKDLLARKRQILSDLMATRKSKKDNVNMSDPSSFAASLIQKAMTATRDMPARVIVNPYESEDDDDETDNYENHE